jgi:hypothetical protein
MVGHPQRTRVKIRLARRRVGVVEKEDVKAPITTQEIDGILGAEGSVIEFWG